MSVLDKSARESLQTFSSGKGDVLLGYENEAILAQQKGEELDYVVPDQTLLIENPVATVTEAKDPELAQSFVDFLYTDEAQKLFVDKGYRPVVDGIAGADEFPEPADLFDDHQVRWLGQGQHGVLRPGEGNRGGDLPVTGEEHCLRLAQRPPQPLLRRHSQGPSPFRGRPLAVAWSSPT